MKKIKKNLFTITIFSIIVMHCAHAAISLDRTRLIFPASSDSVTLDIKNSNTKLPYLAQGWIESSDGKKVSSPFMVLPPIQRVEASAKSQVVVQATPAVDSLPKDRESLFYFNLREIPPQSSKPNTLQIALQTRIKFMYRPKSLINDSAKPFQDKLELKKTEKGYTLNNPTGYYITIVGMQRTESTPIPSDFKPFMIEPKSSVDIPLPVTTIGNEPVITYVSDYGGRPQLVFNCSKSDCYLTKSIKG